jgi:hypothetical protein
MESPNMRVKRIPKPLKTPAKPPAESIILSRPFKISSKVFNKPIKNLSSIKS